MGLLTRGKEYLRDIDAYGHTGNKLQSINHDPDNQGASTEFQSGNVRVKITPTENGGLVVRQLDDPNTIFRLGRLDYAHQSTTKAFNLLSRENPLEVHSGDHLLFTLRARDYGVNPPPNL